MTDTRSRRRGVATAGLALIAGTAIAFVPAAAAQADTTLSGPVNLGTAVTFGVLAPPPSRTPEPRSSAATSA